MSKKALTCSGCNKRFAGLTLFDSHRVGRFKNRHPDYGRICQNSYHLAVRGWRLKHGVWHGPPIPEDKQWWKK
jgi:hypothetical protein